MLSYAPENEYENTTLRLKLPKKEPPAGAKGPPFLCSKRMSPPVSPTQRVELESKIDD